MEDRQTPFWAIGGLSLVVMQRGLIRSGESCLCRRVGGFDVFDTTLAEDDNGGGVSDSTEQKRRKE